LSLPLAFGTKLATIPAPATLSADPARTAFWAPRLASLPGPRVGLAWSGGQHTRAHQRRSLRLATLLPLAASVPALVSLQKEVPEHDRADLAATGRILDLGTAFADFADTAAVIAQLDLVIVVDTAVAHLAAAMGKPTWILLPFAADWRWLLDRDDSPWYPSARLFRQASPGDWGGVVGQVLAALARWRGEAPVVGGGGARNERR
jgi:hypothetical protein